MNPLETYLRNHLAAARAGVALFGRVAEHSAGAPYEGALRELETEIADDLEQLRGIIVTLGFSEDPILSGAALLGERLGRLKPNGRILRRSPLTPLIEVEGLRDAVRAKMAGWDALLTVASDHPALSKDLLAVLLRRGESQEARLREIHRDVARKALAPDGYSA